MWRYSKITPDKKSLGKLTGERVKILIIGFAKIKYMPYLNLYLENTNVEKNDVHLMYWDRDGGLDKTISPLVKTHVFSKHMEDEIPKLGKLGAFLGFLKQAKNLIKKEKFDFIISLTSVPTVLLSRVLLNEYKEKYIFDYRDYTFEWFKPYKALIAKLVENSAMTVYSSEKHLDFLPQSPKLHIAHNFISASLDYRKERILKKCGEQPIRISYWGILRNEEFNRNIINKFANDGRFEVCFYGKKQQVVENLEAYCKDNNVSNIHFYGEYQEDDRYTFAENTDILYNLYSISGTEGMAMGNKFFDGVIFGIPQICTKGSYMGEKAEEYGVGKAVDVNSESFTDDIFEFFNYIDETEFKSSCDVLIAQITSDYEKLIGLIKNILC